MKNTFQASGTQITIVVANENTLGYIFPEQKSTIHVLHASILKGAHGWGNGSSISANQCKSIRVATENDFNDYRVSSEGYKKDTQIYYIKN
jgi:ribose 5-phosphate isomerase RpiB